MTSSKIPGVFCALAFALLSGCGGPEATGGTGGASGSTSVTAGSGGFWTCTTDPLRTGLTSPASGVSVDAFDCPILAWTASYGEPDAMIFKAMIDVESHFRETSVSCPDLPCGTPSGWTTEESSCLGLMQVVPACSDDAGNAGLLPNGHPNLTTDPSASGWAGSVFNPEINVEMGVAHVARYRKEVKMQFSGCTEDQYTLMAIGNYNDNGSAQSCTAYNTAYDDSVLAACEQYAAAAGYPAHAY